MSYEIEENNLVLSHMTNQAVVKGFCNVCREELVHLYDLEYICPRCSNRATLEMLPFFYFDKASAV